MTTPGKLNRSYSESELYRLNLENLCIQDCGPTNLGGNAPLMKKTILIVEEVYHNSVISSKFGQSVPNQLHNIEKLHSNDLTLGSPNTASNAIIRLNPQAQQKCQKLNYNSDEIVPMDVDSICNISKTEKYLGVVEKMDIDTDCDNYRVQRLNSLDGIIKKRKFNIGSADLSEKECLKNDTHISPILCKKNEVRCNYFVLVALFSLTMLCFGLWYFQGDIIYVNNDIQLKNLQKDLLERVYDQKGIVSIIIRSLEHRSHWANKIKVIAFIGPSGVGKTFVANILKRHFHSGLIHELYGIQLDFKSQWESILSCLKSCCLNLIIIEDLNKKDTTTLFELVHSLPKNQYILVISIFSIQYADNKLNYVINYNDISEIRDDFDHSDLFHELAVFNQFNIHQVKDWLEKQLKVQNVPYSEKLLSNVLYNHNASYEGLKGLQSKLLLELETKN
ncbi:uncharacterized protein LOC108915272 [Anoplophora glabripennis]|uniref:uncharacterized protein LOC108915272 n=1 Tax=Anoplophora glabripennis TaxID=217634 RepID=UPI0008735534|nr:uncharacterized protein LOC108915272 [Anoplophora glabripennis]